MNLDEEKVIKSGNRLGWIALTIIAIIVILVITIIISIYKMFTSPIPRKYYVLDVTDNNKEEVIRLYEKDTKYNKKHCDSIYKIEYFNSFPDGSDYIIYCRDEDTISFSTDDAYLLAKYIRENGYTEKRIME